MEKKQATVYRTDNYDKFRHLEGNRPVAEGRVKTIMKSIKSCGYVLNPIVINERNEVVEGQGRLEALKRMEMPVDYVVQPGAGLKECIEMNNSTSRWSITDYVNAYIEQGNQNYVYLGELFKAYKGKIPLEAIFYASDIFHRGGNVPVKNGDYLCNEEAYNEAVNLLELCLKIKPAIEVVKGHRERYFTAACFFVRQEGVSGEILVEKLWKNQEKIKTVASRKDALDCLEEIYNFRNRQKVFTKSIFDREEAEREARM